MSVPVAIVTGGAGGMGRAITTVLVGDGFRVALLDPRGAFLVSDRARNITGEVIHVAAGSQLAPATR